MASDQSCYTLIAKSANPSKQYSEAQLKSDLESSNIAAKTAALKEVIRRLANGESVGNILITVIRFVMPCQDHMIKKLLFVFWEIVPKYSADGKLLHEMILVCEAYRKDLQHPNEYIKGCTLRFLCKLKEPELLEPLMPTIQQCLEDRHHYVRRNAVLAVYTIYKNFDFLFPDAPSRILQFLEHEQDSACKRNAFIMLTHVCQKSALEYLATCLDEVPNFDEILQLVIVELIYKVCHANPNERGRFIRCVYGLLQSKSAAVRYEAAGTLVTLSNAPTAIRAVCSCYIELIMKESDNNVKLIVMDRLIALRINNERIMQDMVMDIVRILGATDLELREKTLEFVSDVVTTRTVDELTGLLVKELVKACSTSSTGSAPRKASDANDDAARFRFAIVHNLYEISMRFPNILTNVVPTMCEVLTYDEVGDSNASAEACRFLRETAQRHPATKSLVLERLSESFQSITGRETMQRVLWIFGEYSTTQEDIFNFMNLVRQIIGDLPLVDNELKRMAILSGHADDQTTDEAKMNGDELLAADGGLHLIKSSNTRVTADGTYATQSAFSVPTPGKGANEVTRPVLQAALFDADYMLGVILSACFVKLTHRYINLLRAGGDLEKMEQRLNAFTSECMLVISSMIHLANSELLPHHVNPDLIDRMWKCFRMLLDRNEAVLQSFDAICQEKLELMLTSLALERKRASETRRTGHTEQKAQQERERNRADAPVKFNLLSGQRGGSSALLGDQDMFELTLSKALGSDVKGGDAYATSKLNKVHQLTGFSDPVYAEAYVHTSQFDILLDILVVNQTSDTLQNLTIELSTLGDMRLVERPSPITLAAEDFTNIKASIKVSSTENGMIFGNIVYDVRGSSGECNCVVLNDIHIDIMEYIQPCYCTPTEYRQMWSAFEWENKVTVNTHITSLRTYLAHILRATNFQCLTPKEAMSGDCDFLSVTMYAKSIFGEHVLANLCLEHSAPGFPVTGHVRIRAETQGMAVTMGDKISSAQKQPVPAKVLKEVGEVEQMDDAKMNGQGGEDTMANSVLIDCSA